LNPKRVLILLLFLFLTPFTVLAEEEKCPNGVDPTIFFIRGELVNEYVDLPAGADADYITLRADYQIKQVVEFRLDVPMTYYSSPPAGSSFGLGDIRTRVGGLLFSEPIAAMAIGLDLFYNTATNDNAGFGKYRIGPAAVVSFYATPWLTISPYFEYRVSFAGDSNRAEYNRMSLQQPFQFSFPNNWWLVLEPRTVIDFANDSKATFYMEVEGGKMVTPHVGLYVRPITRIAGPKITDFSVEAGFRYLWY